jgi:two-component sensor histidine kinase
LLNELITNSLKYAFLDDQIGHVSVRFEVAVGKIELSVEDDGVGCPQHGEPGLGTKLVKLLVDQLGGVLKREDLDPGCRVSVIIPRSALAGLPTV